MSLKKYGCLAGVLLLYAALAAGAESGAVSERSYLDEMPVVLSVSRLAQPLDEAPVAVTVIDRQMIRDSGAWDLSEVMRLVPGMFVAYHAARFYSSDSTVAYRGLMTETMSNRMQVLVDGRSVYSPLYGGVIWSDIPVALDDIERIEAVRGPDSASYGANSFIGVINIVTRHSAETQGKHLSLSTGRSRKEALARYGGGDGNLTYRLTASLRDDEGEDSNITDPTSQIYIWTKNKLDDKSIRLLTYRADYQADPADTLEFQLGYNGGPRQAGEVNDVYAPDKVANNHFEQLHWRRALEQGADVSVQFYHQVESSRALLLKSDNSVAGNGDVFARRYDLEAQHTFSPTADTRLAWGGSVRYDKTFAPYDLGIDGPDLYEDRPYRLARLFGHLEWWARPDLLFNFGAMAEHNNYTGTDITPRVALNWHFLPRHTLRLGYSEATRTPSVFEKRQEEYYRTVGGYPNLPVLLPERVHASDIGYLGKFSALDVDFRLFRDIYSDLIGHRTDSVLNGNLNSGSATAKGYETQLKWNIGERTRLIYGLAHTVVASSNVDRTPYTNSVPTNNQSLMLSHGFDRHWSISVTGYHVDETHFSRTDVDLNQNRKYFIEPVRRWDGRVAYAFQTGEGHGELALNVQNLADAHYFEFRHDNQPPGRTAWLNLKLDF